MNRKESMGQHDDEEVHLKVCDLAKQFLFLYAKRVISDLFETRSKNTTIPYKTISFFNAKDKTVKEGEEPFFETKDPHKEKEWPMTRML